MRKLFVGVLSVVFAFLYSLNASPQGYNIKIRINGLTDTLAILGHYVNKSMYPDDTAWLDMNGYGVFKDDKKLPGGMYVIYLPSTKFFQILIDEDQQFVLETDTVHFVNSLKVKGSDDNAIFYDFQKFMKTLSEEASKIQEQIKNTDDKDQKEELKKQLKTLGDKRIDYHPGYAEKHSRGKGSNKILRS